MLQIKKSVEPYPERGIGVLVLVVVVLQLELVVLKRARKKAEKKKKKRNSFLPTSSQRCISTSTGKNTFRVKHSLWVKPRTGYTEEQRQAIRPVSYFWKLGVEKREKKTCPLGSRGLWGNRYHRHSTNRTVRNKRFSVDGPTSHNPIHSQGRSASVHTQNCRHYSTGQYATSDRGCCSYGREERKRRAATTSQQIPYMYMYVKQTARRR